MMSRLVLQVRPGSVAIHRWCLPSNRPSKLPLVLFSRSFSQQRSKVPASQVPKLWAQAQAVCFDVDCTITKQDALDDLANFLGKGQQVQDLTNAAMNGDMDLAEALQKRLDIMEPTVDKLTAYVQSNPAAPRLVPGIQSLIQELQARNVDVFLISGGFRELILPVADLLKIPRDHIYANRFVYMSDDARLDGTGTTESVSQLIRVTGFDPSQVTSREGGKPEAIRQIRSKKPLQTVVMIGDGITDLEAAEETGGADLFIGYGGVVARPRVQENADWWITDYQEILDALPRFKVAMVGSGAFASAVLQMISQNARDKAIFQDIVDVYVYEEDYHGAKLTSAINQQHENPKYLPGVHFGDNVVANPDLESTVQDADLIIFCAPHQFMHSLCKQIQLIGVKPTAKAISLTKGIHISPEQGPQLMSSMIHRMLNIECSVLMGANLAGEIGPNGLCEATIGSRVREQGHVFQELFDTDYFHVSVIPDIEGAEMAGALKNVVALAAGFADGCDLGQNAKAVVLRQGLSEMRQFAKAMYPNTVRDETFFESCGVADLIATCYGGRNHRVAQEFAKQRGRTSFSQLETDLLNGQKLQGVLTSEEVQSVLSSKGWQNQYPLFSTVNAIVRGRLEPKDISRFRELPGLSLESGGEEPSLLEKTIGF
ncbi:3-phosphate dehydrogenase [Seminavis robusta]|uniref:Glycerol-3-phosphate dehydrogenase [NAD(+)] n=1 Tax=Seminavis robusta TaxID=568900 RepID=A0A9N8HTD7_9STRA|nr:3-phosphate dehydrogenase [Seminavis robusta]|eukprot:Sro1501_g277870.1 3-phosphate dehydrogenase (656) ;mRNA; f:2681-4648